MSKNKVLIMMYQEGASGLDGGNRKGGNYALRCMVHDANVVADTFAEMGITPVVCDVYGVGRDIYTEELSPNATKISISDVPALCRSGELIGAIMTGQHAKNGAPHAFMSYTVNEVAWFEYRLNGRVMGDIGIGAAFLGAFGVPVLAVCGDSAACLEAQGLLGNIPCAEVKSAQIRNWAKCLPQEEADRIIKGVCKEAFERFAEIACFAVEAPYTVSVTFGRADFADDCIMYNNGNAKRISPLICEKTTEKVEKYMDVKF